MSRPLNDPIDRRMVPRREKSFDKSRWWMRSRRTIGFSVMALIDVIILLVIRYGTTNDSDAAGNGMAHAIDIALFEIGGATVCVVTFLYVIIPSRNIRIGFTILMALITVALMVITA
jgi:hypothetical protein